MSDLVEKLHQLEAEDGRGYGNFVDGIPVRGHL